MFPNLLKIEEISDGDTAFKGKMLDVIKSEFPKDKASYISLMKNKDYQECSKLVHKIKHKINLLGFIKGYHIALEYELDLKNDKLILEKDFELILERIEEFLKSV